MFLTAPLSTSATPLFKALQFVVGLRWVERGPDLDSLQTTSFTLCSICRETATCHVRVTMDTPRALWRTENDEPTVDKENQRSPTGIVGGQGRSKRPSSRVPPVLVTHVTWEGA